MVSAVTDADADISISERIGQHGRKHDKEGVGGGGGGGGGGAKTHSCFTPFEAEWLGYLTVVLNSSQHAIMKMSCNGDEFSGDSHTLP